MTGVSRNVSFAFVDGVAALMSRGADVLVSGQRTKELLHRVTVLERPAERFVFVPGRNNDPFAQIAEALWVMAGRDDLAWLSRYLPRAPEFSDDGSTWRGAYGPRLRRWGGNVDQFDAVRKVLLDDHKSRRAVMNLFDPAADYARSRDIPCNNWLSWIVREGRLHLAVAVRSNDIVWGFSGANAFEWSVLHEMLASWLGVDVGTQTWLAGSFHIYERHWDRAARILRLFQGITPYDFGISRAAFTTPWDAFDEALTSWFDAETIVHVDPDAPMPTGSFRQDQFLSSCLGAIRVRWGSTSWGDERLIAELATLPLNDVAIAAWVYLLRKRPALLKAAPVALAVYLNVGEASVAVPEASLKQAIKSLHTRKDRAYDAAWKRRGETVSVLPNIGRKVDRLEVYLRDGARPGDEILLDTAIDLYVYATKYRLLLEEREPSSNLLPPEAPKPFSDHGINFDRLVDEDDFGNVVPDHAQGTKNAVDIFERLWRLVREDGSLVNARELVDLLRDAAKQVIVAAGQADPHSMREFACREAAYPVKGVSQIGAGRSD
jgi:thymidylate synthase